MNRKMARYALSAAAMTTSIAAHSGNNIELYGVLDVGIANVEHSLGFDPYHPVGVIPYANATGTSSTTGMFNGGLSDSRWGVRGSESITNDLKASFVLESAFNVPSGRTSNAAASMANNTARGPNMSADSAISGQLFSRQSWVGLESNSLGQISFGRHQSFFLDNIAEFDPMLGSQIFSPIGFSGTYGGGGNTEDSRVDNSIRYKNRFGNFRIGALYKLGGIAGNTDAQNAFQFNSVYELGDLALVAGYQKFNDAFSASNGASIGTLSVTANDTTAYMLGLKYGMGPATIRLGYEREQFTNPSNPSADAITNLFGFPVSGSVNVTPFKLQKNLDVYWGGLNYDVTGALTLSAAYYQVNQNDYSGTGCSTSSSKCQGKSKFYSLLADYKFSKRTDIYAGAMDNSVSGGLGFDYAYTRNLIVGTGLRHKF